MSFSAPKKDRSQCYASLHCDEYGYLTTWHSCNAGITLYKDRSGVVEFFILQLENKQQSMPINVETPHMHKY